MADADLMRLRQWLENGDSEAFTALVDRAGALVFASSMRILSNASDAEEVVQDCFLALATEGAVVRGSVLGWLHRMATRRSIDRLRSRKRREIREQAYAAQASTVEPVEALEWRELEQLVDEAIDTLPEKLRNPLIRHFMGRESHETIARDLGLTRSAVSHRLSGGIEAVRTVLRKKGVIVPAAVLAGLLQANLSASAAMPASLAAALGKLAVAGPAKAAVAAHSFALSAKLLLSVAAAVIVGAGLVWQLKAAHVEEESAAPSRQISVINEVAALTQETPAREDAISAGDSHETEPSPAVTPEPLTGGRGIVRGIVSDGELGVEGAEVGIAGKESGRWTRTLPDGSFCFEGLPDGEYGVFAHTEDSIGVWGSTGDICWSKPQNRETFCRIGMMPSAAIHGYVTDAAGNTVAGARVIRHDGFWEAVEVLMPVRTDSGGRFTLIAPAPWRTVAEVQAEGFAPSPFELAAGITEVRVVLDSGCTLSGTVRDEATNVPVAGVTILGRNKAEATVETRTGADGCYLFERLSKNIDYQFAVFGNGLAEKELITLVLEENEHEVDFIVSPAACISGRISFKETGKPMAGCKVGFAASLFWMNGQDVRTDAEGCFTLAPLLPAKYSIWAHANGPLGPSPAGTGLAVYQSKEVSVSESQHATVNFEFFRGTNISGRVLDSRLIPIAGARVWIRNELQAETDGAGRYEIRNIPPNSGYNQYGGGSSLVEVYAEAPGCAGGIRKVDTSKDITGIDLMLEPEVVIKGQVVDTAGVAVPYAAITPHLMHKPEREEGVTVPAGYRCGDMFRLVTSADGQGKFSIDGMSPGNYIFGLETRLPQDRRSLTVLDNGQPFALPAGQRSAFVELVVPAMEEGTIEGTVTDAAGRPLPGVDVQASGNEITSHAITDEEGHFLLTGLPEGEYNVKIQERWDGGAELKYATLMAQVPSGTRGLNLRLQPPGSLTGSIGCTTGQIVHAAELSVMQIVGEYGVIPNMAELAQRQPYVQVKDGLFEITQLPPGMVTLEVGAPGYVTQLFDVEVSPGKKSGVRLVISPESVVCGFVTVGGVAESDVTVSISGDDGEAFKSVWVGPDGFYEIKRLPAGEYVLNASFNGTSESKNVSVSPQQTVQVDFHIP